MIHELYMNRRAKATKLVNTQFISIARQVNIIYNTQVLKINKKLHLQSCKAFHSGHKTKDQNTNNSPTKQSQKKTIHSFQILPIHLLIIH